MLIELAEPWPVLIIFPLRDLRHPAVPHASDAEVVEGFRAISRHLKIMESAGLVSGKRDGYYVLYRLETDRLDVLGRTLRSTLGLARDAGGAVPPLPVALHRFAD